MKKRKLIVSIVFLYTALLLFLTANWGVNYFQVQSFDQIIFHLKVPLAGTNSSILVDWAKSCLLQSVVLSILLILAVYVVNRFGKSKKLKKISFVLKKYCRLFSFLLLVLSLLYGGARYDLYTYIQNQSNISNLYDDYYVSPEHVKLEFPVEKRNLIYIYVESLETTFATNEVIETYSINDSVDDSTTINSIDGGGFQTENYIPELTQLALENVNFSNTSALGGAHQVNNTGWTMAGIVAQSSGISLNILIDGDSYDENSPFLPGSYSIGDILEREGYNQEIMVGSDLTFGGRRNYYEQHGNYDVFDLNTAYATSRISEDYYEWWGIEDERLFEFAKEDINTLASKEEPFHFEILTTNTHSPEGYINESCSTDYENEYKNAIACSSQKISDFIQWAQDQPFYENTTIVLTGDHLSMNTSYMKNISEDYTRTVFNIFINPAQEPVNSKNRQFSTMDLFPTTLAAIGVNIEGDVLGLGTNLFSNSKTIIEKLGLDEFNLELSRHSRYYDNNILK